MRPPYRVTDVLDLDEAVAARPRASQVPLACSLRDGSLGLGLGSVAGHWPRVRGPGPHPRRTEMTRRASTYHYDVQLTSKVRKTASLRVTVISVPRTPGVHALEGQAAGGSGRPTRTGVGRAAGQGTGVAVSAAGRGAGCTPTPGSSWQRQPTRPLWWEQAGAHPLPPRSPGADPVCSCCVGHRPPPPPGEITGTPRGQPPPLGGAGQRAPNAHLGPSDASG